MQPVPRIFVSATSRDLRTARGLVAEGLRRMECLPIVQDDFPPDYKSVRDMLRTKIKDCNAVVHLAGFYYGAEPQPVIPGPDRRSFTQMEYEIAMELKLPCYVFLCGKDFPFDKHDPEPEEKQALQMAHRDRLLKRDELFYEFATPEELANRTRELQLSVEGLRGELAKERFRRRLTLAACIVLFLIGGGYFYIRMQKSDAVIAETTVQLQKQGDLIAQLLAEQKRLREAMKEGSPADIVRMAELNVAKANNQTVDDVRRGVEEAISKAQAAVAAAGGDPIKKLNALKALADTFTAAGRTNEAIAAMEQLILLLDRDKDPTQWAEHIVELEHAKMWRDALNNEPEKTIAAALDWAKSAPAVGDFHPATMALKKCYAGFIHGTEECIKLRREVLAAYEKEKGATHAYTLESKVELASALYFWVEVKNGRAEAVTEAEKMVQEVIDAHVKTLGPKHPTTLRSRLEQARHRYRRKNVKGLSKVFQELADSFEKAFGSSHSDTLLCRNLAAWVEYKETKNHRSTVEQLRKVLATSEAHNLPESEETLQHVSSLAAMMEQSGEESYLNEAEILLRRALETRIKMFGAAQPDTLYAFDRLETFLRNYKHDEAEAHKVRLRRLEEQGRSPHSLTAIYAADLAGMASYYWTKKDDPKSGLPFAKRSLEVYQAVVAEDSAHIPAAESLIAALEDAAKNTEQAKVHSRRQVQLMEKFHAQKDKKGLAEAWHSLGFLLVQEGELAEGTSYLEKSFNLANNELSDDKETLEKYRGEVLDAWAKMGEDLGKQNKTDEARVYLQKAADVANAAYPPGNFRRSLADSALAKLAPPPPPAEENAAPSFETYSNFRKNIGDRIKAGELTTTKINLKAKSGRVHYIEGEWSGDKMERAFEWDAVDDKNGTFTLYYFNQHGTLMSIFQIREGVDSPVDDVKKATDTFNFFSGKLVGWKRTQDDAEKVEDPESDGFEEKGQEVLEAAEKVTAKIIKAGPN